MKSIQFFLPLMLLSLLLIIACADLKENLPEPMSSDLEIHPMGWNTDTSAVNFHGKYLQTKYWNASECKSCHGSLYNEGISGKSCFTCHVTFPHVSGWNLDTSNISFHGKYLQSKGWDPTECKSCHGSLYDGGTSGKNCFTCHASFPHETKFFGEDGHENYLENNGYPLNECKTCHGTDLLGGARVNISCSASDCHTDAGGNTKSPEACNTCHGNFRGAADDTLSWAPPRSLSGDTGTTSAGVGAHQAHLAAGDYSYGVKCNQCHVVPSEVFLEGHLDSPPPADLIFNPSLAALITADGTFQPNPSYNTLRCSGTYCHGSWRLRRASSLNNWAFADSVMTGAAYNPSWTGGESEAECGSCHELPPRGHQNQSACSSCHTGIVDASGVITDKSKHINGKVNVLGTERPF